MKTAHLIILFLAVIYLASCQDSQSESTQEENQVEKQTALVEYPPATLNRNQEVSTLGKQPKSRTSDVEIKNAAPFELRAFYQQFDKPSQTFNISSAQDTTIICSEGTRINIPANSLITESGQSVTGEVEVNVREYYQPSDILLANLSTMSNGKLLESGGMVHIDIFAGKEKCNLIEGTSIDLLFPTANAQKEGMQIFSGEWEGDAMNWELQEEGFTLGLTDVQPVQNQNRSIPNEQKAFEITHIDSFINFLRGNFPYPELAIQAGINGTIGIILESDIDGQIDKFRIAKRLHPIMDEPFMETINRFALKMELKDNFGTNIKSSVYIPFYFNAGTWFHQSLDSVELVRTSQRLNNHSIASLGRYVLSSTQLGWINCDWFIQDRGPKRDLIVSASDGEDIDCKLIFSKINSVMPAQSSPSGEIIFLNVPAAHPIKLFALKKEGGQLMLSLTQGVTGDRFEPEFNFQPVTVEELIAEVKKLDG